MHVELAPHSQLAAACRASCPAKGDCRDCPIARMCVRFTEGSEILTLVDRARATTSIRPVIRVENLDAPHRAA